MKKSILFVCFQLLFFAGFSQDEYVEKWQHTVGGTALDDIYCLIEVSDGGYLGVGSTTSTNGAFGGNHGGKDMLVARLDQNKNLIWMRILGTHAYDEAFSALETYDNFFLVAGYSGSSGGDHNSGFGGEDYWLLKIDYLGNIVWEKSYGGNANDRGRKLIKTSDGGYFFAGNSESSNGNLSSNIGEQDFWGVKLDSACNIQWQASFGGTLDDFCMDAVQTADGGYLMSGYSKSSDVHLTVNNGVEDYWVIKIDGSGILQWQYTAGGPGKDYGRSVVETFDGGVVVAGFSRSNIPGAIVANHSPASRSDLWLVKLDSGGNLLWHRYYGGYENDECYKIFENDDHQLVIVGKSYSDDGDLTSNHGNADCWLIHADQSGSIVIQDNWGGSGNDAMNNVNPAKDNSLIFAATSTSFNGDVDANYGSTDGLMFKLTKSYNLISGKIYVDHNGNNTIDGNDFVVRNSLVVENITGKQVYSQSYGEYFLSVLSPGTFSVEPLNIPLYYIASPGVHTANFSNMLSTDSLNDFALQPIGPVYDLKVTMTPMTQFRPGFDASYNLHYSNVGTMPLTPTLIFFPDQGTVYASATTSPNSVTPDSVVWNLPLMNPFTSGDIIVTVTLDAGVVIGSTINSIVRIDPVSGDETPPNNTFAWEVIVTGSADPNDILVNFSSLSLQEVAAQKPLDYIIRFQNTGTDTAFNVNVRNILPVGTDPTTFELINSSHNVQVEYDATENLMWFRFEDILLPDSNINEPQSHGFIHYRILPHTNLNSWFVIRNQAAIYFDYNAPVNTNIATTVILSPVGIGEANEINFDVYPNPFTNDININFQQKDLKGNIQFELFSVSGKKVYSQLLMPEEIKSQEFNIPSNNLSSGIYFMKVMYDDSVFVRKMIKL